jgi:hypothetical protein
VRRWTRPGPGEGRGAWGAGPGARGSSRGAHARERGPSPGRDAGPTRRCLGCQPPPAGEDVAPLTFGVDVERRSCSKFDQKEVIDAFAKAVPAPHKVNLSKPDRTILVQLVRNVCAVAVAPRFKELCKYNVRVAAEPEEEEGGAAAGGGEAGGANAKAVGGGAKDQQQQQQEGKQQAEEQQQEKEDAAAAAADAAAKEPVPA